MNARQSIVIATVGGDIHALAVALALRRVHENPVLLYLSDLPASARTSIRMSPRECSISGLAEQASADAFDARRVKTVWNRRSGSSIHRVSLHPADLAFAASECREYQENALQLLPQTAFWVNPLSSRAAGRKLLQLRCAKEIGLLIPDTLVSNDPKAIRAFIRNSGGHVIYKRLSSEAAIWQTGRELRQLYTTAISAKDLPPDGLLRATPGVFQPQLQKAYELRVTVVGKRVFAARIDSQKTTNGRVDWRIAAASELLSMSSVTLAPAFVEMIHALMNALGLVFGCMDFVVTPRGETVFLEVNPMGQWLFVEQATGAPILDAFVKLLVAGDAVKWKRGTASVHYDSKMHSTVTNALRRTRRRHPEPYIPCYREFGSHARAIPIGRRPLI